MDVLTNQSITPNSAIQSYLLQPCIVPLHCKVQHYDWGDYEFIPRLLGIKNTSHKPYAELWIGAHPDLPADAVIDGIKVPLNRLLARQPENLLGPSIAKQFSGELPFLMKILAARQPLSIQVHPDKKQAQIGFEQENRLGIPLDSPRRNYRDLSHKPELLCALTPFYVLRGFRPLEEITKVLESIPEWKGLREAFQPTEEGLKSFYSHLMTMPQEEVNEYLSPLINRLRQQGEFPKSRLEYWLLKADELYSSAGRKDRGLFSFYLLNYFCLQPGEAIFLPSGVLHTYLGGVGVEIMANSNNVVRGGLTKKHVDVPALLEIVKFTAEAPEKMLPVTRSGLDSYPVPVEEFVLRRLPLPAGGTFEMETSFFHLAIVLQGSLELTTETKTLTFHRGQSFLAPYGKSYRVHAQTDVEIFIGSCRQ
ncbi:MAG TPA: mannose-6-phosphate isomerase, class I [Gammaproteobacteria bacterium]|nr:MAG: hypothetical protein AXA67_05460 [Methylothermaceae bacteria B42]HEC17791.1 mannose-6-phosphate isomerase, class I [Gammaproteobacteria bacterium]